MAGLRTALKSLPEQYSSHRRSLVVPELRFESAADLPRVSPETTRNTLRNCSYALPQQLPQRNSQRKCGVEVQATSQNMTFSPRFLVSRS
jgi:hypothetical protein